MYLVVSGVSLDAVMPKSTHVPSCGVVSTLFKKGLEPIICVSQMRSSSKVSYSSPLSRSKNETSVFSPASMTGIKGVATLADPIGP